MKLASLITRSGKAAALVLLLLLPAGCHYPRTGPPVFQSRVVGGMASTNNEAALSVTNSLDPAWLRPPTNFFTLGPGDKLEIELLGEPASKTTTVVGPDGKIYFTLLPGVDVWGKTLSEAKTALETGLGRFVREKPQVSLVLRGVESKRVWVLGRVQAPGVYPMQGPMTLLEAVSMAGGTLSRSAFRDQEAAGIGEEFADLDRSFLIRNGHILPVDFRRLLLEGDAGQNVYLEPDDFIYLPAQTAREVYVLGAVVQPRPVSYRQGLTVAGAVAGAFGTLDGAYLHHVAVVRGSLTQPEIAIVDYKRIIRGEAHDLALEPRDIVYVPFSPYRYLQRYLDIVINTFASSAAINAGVKAVGQTSAGVGGIFIPVGSGIQIIPPTTPPPIH
jgi:polysaccharide biosynthesis/export protein